MIISGSYSTAISLAHWAGGWTTSPLNPAISLSAISLTFLESKPKLNRLYFSWIFLVFDWVGAFLAVIMYEKGFKKMQKAVEVRDE